MFMKSGTDSTLCVLLKDGNKRERGSRRARAARLSAEVAWFIQVQITDGQLMTSVPHDDNNITAASSMLTLNEPKLLLVSRQSLNQYEVLLVKPCQVARCRHRSA